LAIVTLTTDFGWRDNFVGVMKGVILARCPQARLVDLAHDLPAHDVAQAAFSLWSAWPFFPEGTVHLAVVDPGVGGQRAVLAVRAAGRYFVAPDNGLLSYVLDDCPDFEARRIEHADLRFETVSHTFHGRDVMAPAAARLAAGFAFDQVGPGIQEPVRLPLLKARAGPDAIQGRVVYVDRFGNLITNIDANDLAGWDPDQLTLEIGDLIVRGLSAAYASAEPGRLLALGGSQGLIEIARNQGRAEDPPRLTVGTTVVIRRQGP